MNKEIEEKIQKLFLAEQIIQEIKTKIEKIDYLYQSSIKENLCDENRKIKIYLSNKLRDVSEIVCDEKTMQKLYNLIKIDYKKQLNSAEKNLKRVKKELKRML